MPAIGFWELLLIFALGTIVLGPIRVVTISKRIKRWMESLGSEFDEMKRTIDE